MSNRNSEIKTALYVLHIGLIELRELARKHQAVQIEELADALEYIPTECLQSGALMRFKDSLQRYRTAFPDDRFDYSSIIDLSSKKIVDSAIRD